MQSLVIELYQERDDLINRLNAIHNKIECEDGLIRKVHLQIEWLRENRHCVQRLTGIITDARSLLAEYGDNYVMDINDTYPMLSRTASTPEEDNELKIEQLKIELYETNLSMISQGFVQETSYSERGSNRYETTLSMIPEGFVKETSYYESIEPVYTRHPSIRKQYLNTSEPV